MLIARTKAAQGVLLFMSSYEPQPCQPALGKAQVCASQFDINKAALPSQRFVFRLVF